MSAELIVMTLTPQNMRTDPSGNAYSPAALREDVTHMDGKQMKKYIRLAFQGEVDPKFLPVGSDFWRAWGSTHPQAGRFFAGIYTTMPHALDGSFTRADRSKLDFDPQYAVRFESILKKFLEECINYQGKPTRRKLMIAQGCVDAVDDIRFHSGPNSPEMQFIRPLQEKNCINCA